MTEPNRYLEKIAERVERERGYGPSSNKYLSKIAEMQGLEKQAFIPLLLGAARLGMMAMKSPVVRSFAGKALNSAVRGFQGAADAVKVSRAARVAAPGRGLTPYSAGSASARTGSNAFAESVGRRAGTAVRGAMSGVSNFAKSFKTPDAIKNTFTSGMGRNMTRMEGAKVNAAYNVGRAKAGVSNYMNTTTKMDKLSHGGTAYMVGDAIKGSGTAAASAAGQSGSRMASAANQAGMGSAQRTMQSVPRSNGGWGGGGQPGWNTRAGAF